MSDQQQYGPADDDAQPTRIPPERNRGGDWVRLGDELYRIPPLAFRSVIDLQERVEGLRNMGARPTTEQMDTVAEVVHAAIARNYPSMTIETIGEMLDLGNYQDVLSAVLKIGGFKKGGAAGPAGEAPASAGMPHTSP